MKRRIGNALTFLGLTAVLIGFAGMFLPLFERGSQGHEHAAGYHPGDGGDGDDRGWKIAEHFVWGLGAGMVLLLLGGHLCGGEGPKKESRRFRNSPGGRKVMLSVSILALAVLWMLILYLLVLALMGLFRPSGETGSLGFKFTLILAFAAVLILVIIPLQVVRYVRERRALR